MVPLSRDTLDFMHRIFVPNKLLMKQNFLSHNRCTMSRESEREKLLGMRFYVSVSVCVCIIEGTLKHTHTRSHVHLIEFTEMLESHFAIYYTLKVCTVYICAADRDDVKNIQWFWFVLFLVESRFSTALLFLSLSLTHTFDSMPQLWCVCMFRID